MRLFCLTVLLLLAPVWGGASAAEEEHSALMSATEAMLTAQERFDVTALDALLAPDYVEVSPIGEVDERTEVLSFYTPEARAEMLARGIEPLSHQVKEPRVRVYGDHGIMIATNLAMLKVGDKVEEHPFRFQFHFRLIDDKWMLQTAQYTAITSSGADQPGSAS